jgi:N-acetylated-alpha-linked acidic dipeptidase
MRSKRTIVLASWDGEEYAMTSSTEWGEQHEPELRDKAVAYLNVDAAVSGSTFSARSVPSLAHAVASAAGVADAAIDTRIGAGSDYTVFLNHIGVPIVDMRFQGPYPVYHSSYDTHEYVTRMDQGFTRHAELTRIWATLAIRLANADLLPFDHVRYAHTVRDYLLDIERRWGSRFQLASAALSRFESAAARRAAATTLSMAAADTTSLELLNQSLMDVEPALTDDAGLRGRPWYRHQVYAPAFNYQPETLPGLSEAVDAHDPKQVADAEKRLAAALDRAARALSMPVEGS